MLFSRLRGPVVALSCALALLAACLPARADVTGALRGHLRAPSGAPIAGATVTLRAERTDLSTTTARDGSFVFVAVPFGRYDLSASTAQGEARATVAVATASVSEVNLVAEKIVGRTATTTAGVNGTPVSENAYGGRELAALPANNDLKRIVETLPGIVRFSYDEPVAHGFHGVTYELDGAPLPQSTSANFAQLIDPRDLADVEVFTGAFPAEFGGSRMGAVVNIRSALTEQPAGTSATLGAGTYGTNEARILTHLDLGRAQIGVAFTSATTLRGLDTPSREAQHDGAVTTNAFVRAVYRLGERDVLASDITLQNATFQIPIATDPNDPDAPVVSLPGTDDVQRENTSFASLSYTHTSKDGLGYVRLVPWIRNDRVRYLGDLAMDVLASVTNPDGSTTPQNGLQQDRKAAYAGMRAAYFRSGRMHAVKAGVDLSQESLASNTFLLCGAGNCANGASSFSDIAGARGTNNGYYLEDRWTPNRRFSMNLGLRADASTGYVSGSQLSPRVGVDQAIGTGTIAHAYLGRMYAAPSLEDTRRDAVVTQTASTATPVYDLKPERDSYLELGVAHTFASGARAYVNAFSRNAVNVLDTTNLLNTPLFAVFNNAVGRDRGIEFRYTQDSARANSGVSFTYSRAEAAGVSGSTFLFSPDAASDLTFQPEDHDQTYAGNAFLTRRFGRDLATFVTLQGEYGTGFPVQFQNGNGRLPAHTILNLVLGRTPTTRRPGFALDVENLLDHRYLIKVNNGFNTTQWNAPRVITLRLSTPL